VIKGIIVLREKALRTTSGKRISVPDIATEEKRRRALRDTVRDLRRFHKKILEAHCGKPIPSSVPEINETREGR